MKKLCYFMLVLLPATGFSQGILGKFKQKVKDRIEQRTEEGMDKVLDKTESKISEGKKKNKSKEDGEVPATKQESVPVAGQPSFKSYSRYDFIPGEQVVYAEDFSQDVIGEFPLKWSTNNHGETQTIDSREGKWMRMYQSGRFISPYIKRLPENFTAEFDVVMNVTSADIAMAYPELLFKLVSMPPGDERAKNYLIDFTGITTATVTIMPSVDVGSIVNMRVSQKNDVDYFNNPSKEVKALDHVNGRLLHIAIWVQKERYRLWINGEKVYDIPQAIPANASFNRFELETGISSYEDERVGYFISNIKFAQGAPDMRSKLLTEGKLVTTGILFDVNSDRIKPESTGVLQEIAKVLKENPSVRVMIVGHTDSDGDVEKNKTLSKQRSAAVKQALSAQFGIEANRMETDGKGSSQPATENNSKEGKAQNRRVEFIKQQ
ncbi:MAG: OmpA family protein [Sediminibacterium sp.]|nr:OmpA family protein [Sediminibacterium sp.]